MKTFINYTPVLLAVILLAIGPDVIYAETIRIPLNQPTIQAGIDAAVDGDTVLVADGTYTGDGNRDIDFKGKAIVVRSENGYEHCIVDCEGGEENNHQGFLFISGETKNSVLEGFTIKNAWLHETDCMAENSNGGGILALASPIIRNNKICNNKASFGGGIAAADSALVINNIICDNVSTRWGGGILVGNNARFESNLILNNTASSMGGGIWYRHGYQPLFINNIIAGNHTNGKGGGMALSACDSIVIVGNLIMDNTATLEGGGLYIDVADWEEQLLSIFNNSFLYNTGSDGGGIYNNNTTDTITNCIIWGNDPNDVVNCNLSYSCLQQEIAGEGNIYDDPLLVEWDTLITSAKSSSPCVNAGKPGFINHSLPEADYLGNSRIADGRIDIGAFEIIANPNGIPPVIRQMFLAYPNPASDFLTIQTENHKGELSSFQLLDSQGRVIIQDECTGQETIDISTLPSGTYYLNFDFDNLTTSKCVIIL